MISGRCFAGEEMTSNARNGEDERYDGTDELI